MLRAVPSGRTLPTLAIMAAAAAMIACGEKEPLTGGPVKPGPGEKTECGRLGGAPEGPREAPRRRRLVDVERGGELPYGFNDGSTLNGALSAGRAAALQKLAGTRLWRVALDWRFAEPEPREFEFAAHDAVYCAALARGIRPIFHITGAPEWAADESGGCPVTSCIDPPAESALDDLREFAERIAHRYPELAAIEAWNEPNLAAFWTEPDPARYTAVLAAIDEGVDAAETATPVLGGSLSNTRRTSPEAGRFGFAEFFDRMYEAGAADHMDAVSFHPYPLEPLASRDERFTKTMAELRRIIARNGDRGRRIWVTEVGLPLSATVTPAQQGRSLREIYDRLAADRKVDAVLFHTLLDGPEPSGPGYGFGWLEWRPAGGVHSRPVYREFARRR